MSGTKIKATVETNITPLIPNTDHKIGIITTQKSLRPTRSLLPPKSFKPTAVVSKDGFKIVKN